MDSSTKITHPQVVQTCSFFLPLNSKEDMLVLLLVAIDFHIMEINGYHQLFGYQHSLKYLLLCSTEGSNSHRFGTSQ